MRIAKGGLTRRWNRNNFRDDNLGELWSAVKYKTLQEIMITRMSDVSHTATARNFVALNVKRERAASPNSAAMPHVQAGSPRGWFCRALTIATSIQEARTAARTTAPIPMRIEGRTQIRKRRSLGSVLRRVPRRPLLIVRPVRFLEPARCRVWSWFYSHGSELDGCQCRNLGGSGR
jgi:hypothetical protein